MKLYNFPYLVAKEILCCMPFGDLLIFTQCSKNNKLYIRFLMEHQLKKRRSIQVSFVDKDSWSFRVEYSKFLVMRPLLEAEDNTLITMNLFGIEVKCCTPFANKPLTIFGDKEYGEDILQNFHNLMFDTFGSQVEYNLKVGEYGYESEKKDHIPKLKNITRVAIDFAYSKKLEEDLMEFLKISPELKYIHLSGIENSDFLEIPEIKRIPELDVSCMGGNLFELLKKFTGTKLRVSNKSMDDASIIKFLNDWKLNNAFGNIRQLIFHRGRSLFKANTIMEQCDIKQFDLGKEPPIFISNMTLGVDTLRIPIESDYYAVRESDGGVASLKITPKLFQFGFWNMTKEELLEKHANGEVLDI